MANHIVYHINQRHQVEELPYTTPDGKKGQYGYEAKIDELNHLRTEHAQKTGESLVEISSANRQYHGRLTDPNQWGKDCSAMNLRWNTTQIKPNGQPLSYTVENLFQSSKNFEQSGSHAEWLQISPFQAKQNADNLSFKKHEKIQGFKLFDHEFPGDPHSFFYNFMYAKTLAQPQNQHLANNICRQTSFSDIYSHAGQENSQAQASAIVSALNQRKLLLHAIKSPANFKHDVYDSDLLKQSTQKKMTVSRSNRSYVTRPVKPDTTHYQASDVAIKKPLVDDGLEF